MFTWSVQPIAQTITPVVVTCAFHLQAQLASLEGAPFFVAIKPLLIRCVHIQEHIERIRMFLYFQQTFTQRGHSAVVTTQSTIIALSTYSSCTIQKDKGHCQDIVPTNKELFLFHIFHMIYKG